MEQIEALRRQRFTGQHIARDLGVSPATVSPVLRRLGLNRIAALKPAGPLRRHEPSLDSLGAFTKGGVWRSITAADVSAWANHRREVDLDAPLPK